MKIKLSELRKIIKEEIQIIAEDSWKYPTQDDADAMNDWYNAMNNVYIGASPQLVRKAFDKAEKIRTTLHTKIFGDNSPWSLKRNGNKTTVVWDKDKAKRLGIG